MASRLFALRPIGLGTTEIESFSSWVRRIAYEHVVAVPTLLRGVVAPEIAFGTSQFTDSMNGRSGRTALLLERLVALTEVPEVRQTTLAPLANVLSLRGVFRRKRAWCRRCLRGAAVCYDRLAWALKDVEVCFVHGCLLDEQCGRCGKPHNPWHEKATPAFCPHCGSGLWVGNTAPGTAARLRRGRIVVELLGNMQSLEFTADAVRAGFGQVVKLHGTIRAAAVSLGLHEHTLADIVGDGSRMKLSTFIAGVSVAGGDVRAFLACRDIPQRRRGDWNPQRSLFRRRQDIAEIGAQLRAALAQPRGSRPSLDALCRALRVGDKVMRNNFPLETKQLLDDARQVRADRRRDREAEQSRRVEEIERVVLDLVADGRRPSMKVVQERLGCHGLLMDPLYRRAWQRAVATHDLKRRGGSREEPPMTQRHVTKVDFSIDTRVGATGDTESSKTECNQWTQIAR